MPSKRDTPQQHSRCQTCQHLLVRARLQDGREIVLDTVQPTYRLVLEADNQHYRAERSGAYQVHHCLENTAR